MQVMVWFYKHVDTLGRLMRKVTTEQRRKEGLDVNEDDNDDDEEEVVIEPFEILCSDEYNFTKNRICVINNPLLEILLNQWKIFLERHFV